MRPVCKIRIHVCISSAKSHLCVTDENKDVLAPLGPLLAELEYNIIHIFYKQGAPKGTKILDYKIYKEGARI